MRAGVEVFCGVDVGKGRHHVCALTAAGAKLLDRGVANDERALREVLGGLAEYGRVLVVVDQVSGIAALPLAVARDLGLEVAYLPGLTMRRLADLYPGRDKTDARDAFVIADAARTLPHTLRQVGRAQDTEVEIAVLVGLDDDLANEVTTVATRLRDALLHVHPALERLLGPRITKVSVLNILAAAPTPAALRELGADGMAALMSRHTNKAYRGLPDKVMVALGEQTVQMPGTTEFGRVIASLAQRLLAVQREREAITAALHDKLNDHPVAQIMTSMPGIAINGAARLLTTIGDASGFQTPDHLAAYAGLAPVTRQSGSSLNNQRQARRGNRTVKNVFFYAARTSSVSDPTSRSYYQRKRAEGKRHNGALIALARRKVTVLHAMLRTQTPYQRPETITEDPGQPSIA